MQRRVSWALSLFVLPLLSGLVIAQEAKQAAGPARHPRHADPPNKPIQTGNPVPQQTNQNQSQTSYYRGHHHHYGGYVRPYPYFYPYPLFPTYSIAIPGQVLGPYVLPPLVLSPDGMYGPQVTNNFFGWQPNGVGVGVVAGGINQGPAAPVKGAAPPEVKRPKPRSTNAASKTRAGKFLQFGDTQFSKQKYHAALERYREAALAAPDLAETYFRQGFALFATAQYESAAKAFERGLAIQPKWAATDFSLATLYGPGNQLATTSHREALAQAIEANGQNVDQLMVMGIILYFDGEPERSLPFFQRAAELGANERRLLDGFLAPRPQKEQAAEPGPLDKVDAPVAKDKF